MFDSATFSLFSLTDLLYGDTSSLTQFADFVSSITSITGLTGAGVLSGKGLPAGTELFTGVKLLVGAELFVGVTPLVGTVLFIGAATFVCIFLFSADTRASLRLFSNASGLFPMSLCLNVSGFGSFSGVTSGISSLKSRVSLIALYVKLYMS